MKVQVFSDDGNLLFTDVVGSDRECDANSCVVNEVLDALLLATHHHDLIQRAGRGWETQEQFFKRRERDRKAAA